MLLICYQNKGLSLYKEYTCIEDFKKDCPDIQPTYVFDISNGIAYNITASADEFNTICENYGFCPNDFNREFQIKQTRYVLKSFEPRNRKYKCIVYSPDTQKNYKMTPDYVHRYMYQ